MSKKVAAAKPNQTFPAVNHFSSPTTTAWLVSTSTRLTATAVSARTVNTIGKTRNQGSRASSLMSTSSRLPRTRLAITFLFLIRSKLPKASP